MTLRILHWLSRCILAGIFLYTGYIKLDSPLQFAAAIEGYKLFPERLIWPIASYFPWVEIAIAVLLLIGWKMRYIASAAVLLMLFFIAILTITYARGIDANCGCFSFDDRISLKTIARDSIIIIPAFYLLADTFFRRKKQTGPEPQ